ncbi:MAG: hypothetical protein F9K44_04705 [Hyphomicrobiaceae bacterium]|nr:MAG: hypothetical protein F9K44_04705 [Hyphomicrobiaceae bacterium]
MRDAIRAAAEVSVARGCGFAALAIFTLMIGLADQFYVACKAGGILTLGTCFILVVRGYSAPTFHYKRTEVWLMLPEKDRPPAEIAQIVIGGTLREVYLRFAVQAAIVATCLFGISLILQIAKSRFPV